MPDTDALTKRIEETLSKPGLPHISVATGLLREAAAALSAAREREARHAVYMTDKADQLWQQARAEAMEEAAKVCEAVAADVNGADDDECAEYVCASRIRALAAGQGGENG